MADGRSLDSQQQSALVACLRAIGDGELHVERARCKLCEDRSFDAFETFKNLQGPHFNQKGWVSAHDLYVWFSAQPHSLASASLEEVAGMLQPFVNQLGELRYEGFLRLVLPKDPAHSWLKEIALMKGASSQSGWRGDHEDRLPSEVLYRLCQLFEAEMDMYRHLKFHRQNLHSLAVYRDRLMRFFDVEAGTFGNAGGLICPSTVRRLVMEKLQALSESQCDALLRRINPTGAYFAAFDELARFMSWPSGPSASLFPTQPGPAPALASSATNLPRQKSGSLDHSHVSCHSSSTPGQCEACPPQSTAVFGGYTSPPNRLPLDTSRSFSESAIIGASHSTPAPRLREPAGPLVSRMPEPPRSPVLSPRVKSRPGTWETSPALPSRQSWPTGATRPVAPAPGSNDFHREGLPSGSLPVSQQLSAGVNALPPEPRRQPAWSPERKSFALDTTRASTSELFSPRSYRSTWRSSASLPAARSISPSRSSLASAAVAACGAGAGALRPLSPRRPSSPWPPRSPPRRRGSSPLQSPRRRVSHAWRRECSAEAVSRLSHQSHHECSGSSLRVDRSWMSESRDQMLKAVLQLMLRQADTDARCEEAKVLLPPGSSLEAIFECLDRFRKGSVTETDLWQFSQDYSGTTSYASLASLVHEVQLRRPKDQSSVPGRLSLRETGIMVLPLNTKEYDAVLQAATDADARNVLHLIRDYRSRDPAVTPPVEPLVGATRYQLYRLIDTSARATEDLSCFRSQLALTPGYDLSALSDVFHRMAHGKLSMTMADLRHVFFQQNILISESQLGLIWHRYLPYGSSELAFPDFARQLKPRSAIA